MKDNQELSQICTSVLEARDNNPYYLGEFIPECVNLKDTSAYPLARTVPMPSGYPYATGRLGFSFRDLRCAGVPNFRTSPDAYRIEGRKIYLKLTWDELHLQGNYFLDAQSDPEISLDTAGNLGETPAGNARVPLPAGADPVESSFSATQQAAYLDQARDHRARLMQTPNGPELMSIYNEHNEQYNLAFLTNAQLREVWKADGVTAQMAADTSEALQTGAVINPQNKKYANQQSYNANAFRQQMNIAVATVMLDEDFDPYGSDSPNPDTPSYKAAMAAVSFQKAVNCSGNHADQITEMTAAQVYANIQNHTGGLPAATHDEIDGIVMQGIQPAGNDAGTDAPGPALDEEDRRRIRLIIESALRSRAETSDRATDILWQGRCDACIRGTVAQMELTVQDQSDSLKFAVADLQIELPVFDLHIDDSQWSGAAGEIARDRLSRAYFIRSLLHHHLVDQLKEMLTASVRQAFERAAEQFV
jgi:hypothetical protein